MCWGDRADRGNSIYPISEKRRISEEGRERILKWL